MRSQVKNITKWTDESTGYKCLALQAERLGHWCGYVQVPAGHPVHGKDYDDIDVKVHGGLTFSGSPLSADDKEFWVGFDCAHAWDYVPGLDYDNEGPMEHQTFKTYDFVHEQCHTLAAQLKDME